MAALSSLLDVVAAWNATHPIGTLVIVQLDGDRQRVTRTRSEAWMLGETQFCAGHTPVVLLQGISGALPLSRVFPTQQRISRRRYRYESREPRT